MNLYATFSYPGLSAITQASVRLPSGRSPGRIRIVSQDSSDSPNPYGTFQLTEQDLDDDPVSSTFIAMPLCAVVQSTPQPDGSLITILEDFRWLWRFGAIDGVYNRTKDNEDIEFEKTPQELATMLLDAMGEVGYDISALPNDARPFVKWRSSVPSVELDRLCSKLGCKIDLDEDGKVLVSQVGVGNGLPNLPNRDRFVSNATVAQLPTQIRLATGNVQYECRFPLEAIGPDTDNTWKPINSLSWKPSGVAWGDSYPYYAEWDDDETITLEGVKQTKRQAAQRYIFKYYRPTGVVGGGGENDLNPPGMDESIPDIEELEQLYPLKNYRNQFWLDAQGVKQQERARLHGTFFEEDPDKLENSDPNSTWSFGWRIDGDRGHIITSQAAILESGDSRIEADLTVTCVVEADWVGLNQKVYYSRWRDNADNKAIGGVATETRKDIMLRYTPTYEDDGDLDTVADNLAEVDAECDHYLDAMALKYQQRPSGTVYHSGIHKTGLAGDIHEIQWSAGGAPSETVIGFNANISPWTPDYKEAQRISEKKAIEDAVAAIEPTILDADINLDSIGSFA